MSEKRPFFSVIVPAHNAADFMQKGLDSIRSQDFVDYELFIICDDDDEKTIEAAKEYTEKVLTTEKHNLGSARNKGLDAAKGEWILFMDDDDWYLPGAFGIIAEELKRQKDIDILAYGFEWKGMGVARQSPSRIYPAVWNKAWRREFIGEDRFPEWSHSEDLYISRNLHPRARFAFLNMPLYYYNFMRKGCKSEQIRNGQYDKNELPASYRAAAEGYERWLKSKEF